MPEWFYRGIRLPEGMEGIELLIVLGFFLASLALTYLVQRWLSGDEYYK